MFTKAIRRLLSKSPVVYEIGATIKLIWLRLYYSGGDVIAAISLIKSKNGLALDIGANRAQSAVRMLKLKPGFKVISFEPNKKCVFSLKIAKVILGSSFHYELFGLSDKSGERTYYEPYVNSLAVAAEGTFCPENLDESLEKRIGHYEIRKSTFSTRTLDELNLSPIFLKIDVQGAELDVLRGARNTIIRCKPIIVVEKNAHNEEQTKLYLEDLGYVAISSATATEAGVGLGDLAGDNVFVIKTDLSTPSS